jgi:U4/U6.U5 tri-snRNP-associated protein 2
MTDVDAPAGHAPCLYDLVANITHESVAGTTRDKEHTVWKVHLRAGSGGGEHEKWYQIQDLIVEETRKEMIFLGETALQVHSFLFGSWHLLTIGPDI